MDVEIREIDVEDLLEEPYAVRQLITFVDEGELEGHQDNIPDDGETDDSQAPSKGEAATNIAMGAAQAVRSPTTAVLSAATAVVLTGAWMVFSKYREHDIPFLAVPFSWASELRLPPGHPRKGTLYAAHPSTPQSYLPVSEFHRLTFEDKFTEALRILMHLGASEIDVKHERGWGRDFAGEIDAGIPTTGGEASLKGESKAEKKALYHAELAGHNDPTLPDNLVWLPHESTWQALVEGRKDFGLKEFSLTLQYTDDYDIDADLAVDAENAGLSLGGSFEKHQSTVWEIEGKFSS